MRVLRMLRVLATLLFISTIPLAANTQSFDGCVEQGVKRFTFNATLFESYGTLATGQILSATLEYDPATKRGLYVVSHATAGSLSGIVDEINVFDNGFGGATDAIGVGIGSVTGSLAGISPTSTTRIYLDFRGNTSVISSTAIPTTASVWNAFPQRTLGLPAPSNPSAATGKASPGNFTDVTPPVCLATCVPAGTKRFEFSATLFEPYGTLPTGQVLSVSLEYDPATKLGTYVVSHPTGGSLTGTVDEINVFDNGFGGTADAIGVGIGSISGQLGGISPTTTTRIYLDFRGNTSVISSSAVPVTSTVWNAFPQRTLGLPAPSNPSAATGVASPGSFTDVTPPACLPNCVAEGAKRFEFKAILFEAYGTLASGQTLYATLEYDPVTKRGKYVVSHRTGGALTGIVDEINVFDNGFGGTTDAIGVGIGSVSGELGGVSPTATTRIYLDFRGSTSVISSSAVPISAATWNAFPQRTLGLPAPSNPAAATGVAAPATFIDVTPPVCLSSCVEQGVKRFDFKATLFEPYGTLATGQTLNGTLEYDPATRRGVYVVWHRTAGSLRGVVDEINVFDNGFGGTTDAIGVGIGNLTGAIGGIAPTSTTRIVLDFRGNTSVISSTAVPTTASVWNAFPQRTLALPAPSNPAASTGVASQGALTDVTPPSCTVTSALITVDPQAFPGSYTIVGVGGPFTGVRTFDLAPGSYSVDIGAAGSCSRKAFVVTSSGVLANGTPDSSGAFEFGGNVLRFRNANVYFDPGPYLGRQWIQLAATVQPAFYFSGSASVVVVPDNVYRIRIDGSGSSTYIRVAASGLPQYVSGLSGICATANSVASSDALDISGTTVSFRTTTVRVDPRSYTGTYLMSPLSVSSPFAGGVRDFVLVRGFDAQIKLASLDALGHIDFVVRPDGTLADFVANSSVTRAQLDNSSSPPVVRFHNVVINFNPGEYAGNYRLDRSTPTTNAAISGPLTLITVPDLGYEMRIGASRIAYRVDAGGNVTGLVSAPLIDGSLLFTAAGGTATFRNVRIYAAPSDSSLWRINDVTLPAGWSGSQQVVVVPAVTYQLFDFDHGATGNNLPFKASNGCTIDPAGGVSIGATSYRISCAPRADAGVDLSTEESVLVTLDGSASSVAADATPIFQWTQIAGPEVTLTGANTATPSFTTPLVSPLDGSQVLTFQLIVSDSFTSSEPDAVNITVVHTNVAPYADAGNDVAIREGTSVTLDGTNSFDPENDAMTYRWSQTAGPLVTLSDSSSATPNFQAPAGGASLLFQLQVSDGALSSDLSAGNDPTLPDTVQVSIVQNGTPLANAGENQAVDEGAPVQLNGTASSDPDNDGLTYQWTQTSGPTVSLSDAQAATPSFTAPLVSAGGTTLEFALVVTDDYLFAPRSSTPATTLVHVRDLADPPNCSTARSSVDALWPPRHQMIEVGIEGIGAVNGSLPAIAITAVTQDEPTLGVGRGDTSPDAIITGSTVLLRAERDIKGDGRVYTIYFTATSSGLSCNGSVTVGAPRNRIETSVDNGQQYDSTK